MRVVLAFEMDHGEIFYAGRAKIQNGFTFGNLAKARDYNIAEHDSVQQG